MEHAPGGRAHIIPGVVIGIVVGLLRHGSRWNLLLCFLVVIWQVVFVGSGIALVAGPLLERPRGPEPMPGEPQVAMPNLSSAM